MYIDIDNDAATGIYRFQGDFKDVDFLRYEVHSLGARLRAGGSAAIIGVGGGRDVMSCALFGFHRIVGIEINNKILDVSSRRMAWYSGFGQIPALELHNDEGRSYLTRSHEQFDLVEATLVDTWAATAAGAMALTENSLYTLDGWRIFYQHLKPGGIVAFSRWNHKPDFKETPRLFSLAYATLLSEGVQDPESHLGLNRPGGFGHPPDEQSAPHPTRPGKDSRHSQRTGLRHPLSARGEPRDDAVEPRYYRRTRWKVWPRCVPATFLTFLPPPMPLLTFLVLSVSMPSRESCEFPVWIGRCFFRSCT